MEVIEFQIGDYFFLNQEREKRNIVIQVDGIYKTDVLYHSYCEKNGREIFYNLWNIPLYKDLVREITGVKYNPSTRCFEIRNANGVIVLKRNEHINKYEIRKIFHHGVEISCIYPIIRNDSLSGLQHAMRLLDFGEISFRKKLPNSVRYYKQTFFSNGKR